MGTIGRCCSVNLWSWCWGHVGKSQLTYTIWLGPCPVQGSREVYGACLGMLTGQEVIISGYRWGIVILFACQVMQMGDGAVSEDRLGSTELTSCVIWPLSGQLFATLAMFFSQFEFSSFVTFQHLDNRPLSGQLFAILAMFFSQFEFLSFVTFQHLDNRPLSGQLFAILAMFQF